MLSTAVFQGITQGKHQLSGVQHLRHASYLQLGWKTCAVILSLSLVRPPPTRFAGPNIRGWCLCSWACETLALPSMTSWANVAQVIGSAGLEYATRWQHYGAMLQPSLSVHQAFHEQMHSRPEGTEMLQQTIFLINKISLCIYAESTWNSHADIGSQSTVSESGCLLVENPLDSMKCRFYLLFINISVSTFFS